MKNYSYDDGKILLQSHYNKIKWLSKFPKGIRPRIYKNVIAVTEIASCTLVSMAFKNSNIFEDSSDLLKFWSIIIVTLMKSDLEFNMNGLRLTDMIHTFVSLAPTAHHLYMMCDVFNDNVS